MTEKNSVHRDGTDPEPPKKPEGRGLTRDGTDPEKDPKPKGRSAGQDPKKG